MCSLTYSNNLFLKCVALSDFCWFMSVLLQSSLWRYTVTLMESHSRKYKAFLQESAHRDVRLYKLRHCILLSFWLDSYITEFLKAGNTEGTPAGESCSESLSYPHFSGAAKEMVIASFIDWSSGSVIQLLLFCICTVRTYLQIWKGTGSQIILPTILLIFPAVLLPS